MTFFMLAAHSARESQTTTAGFSALLRSGWPTISGNRTQKRRLIRRVALASSSGWLHAVVVIPMATTRARVCSITFSSSSVIADLPIDASDHCHARRMPQTKRELQDHAHAAAIGLPQTSRIRRDGRRALDNRQRHRVFELRRRGVAARLAAGSQAATRHTSS